MPRLRVKARRLDAVDVVRVSLVDRGANAAPFKIVKRAEGAATEDTMPNGLLARLFPPRPVEPAVIGVLVDKAADGDALRAALAKAGLPAGTRTEGELANVYAFTADGLIPDDAVPYAVASGVYVVVAGEPVAKAMSTLNMQTTSFREIMAQEGFRPGVRMALDGLGSVFFNITAQASSRDEMVAQIEAAVDDFGVYVAALARAVPQAAFVVEDELDDVMMSEAAPTAPTAPEGDASVTAPAEPEVKPKAEAPAAEPAPVAPKADAPAAPAADAPAVEPAPDLGAVVAAAVGKALEGLDGRLKEIATSVAEGSEKIAVLEHRMGEVAAVAEKAEAEARTAKSAVTGTAPEDAPKVRVLREGGPPLLDTAETRRRAG